jgi:hypothetical protein
MLVNGTSKDTGAICDDIEELKFDITTSSPFPRKPSSPPSRSPVSLPANLAAKSLRSSIVKVPSQEPSSPPSPVPSQEPSKSSIAFRVLLLRGVDAAD